MRLPFTVGVWGAAAGFRPMDENFGASNLYYGGLEIGYAFPLLRSSTVRINLRPMIRPKSRP